MNHTDTTQPYALVVSYQDGTHSVGRYATRRKAWKACAVLRGEYSESEIASAGVVKFGGDLFRDWNGEAPKRVVGGNIDYVIMVRAIEGDLSPKLTTKFFADAKSAYKTYKQFYDADASLCFTNNGIKDSMLRHGERMAAACSRLKGRLQYLGCTEEQAATICDRCVFPPVPAR